MRRRQQSSPRWSLPAALISFEAHLDESSSFVHPSAFMAELNSSAAPWTSFPSTEAPPRLRHSGKRLLPASAQLEVLSAVIWAAILLTLAPLAAHSVFTEQCAAQLESLPAAVVSCPAPSSESFLAAFHSLTSSSAESFLTVLPWLLTVLHSLTGSSVTYSLSAAPRSRQPGWNGCGLLPPEWRKSPHFGNPVWLYLHYLGNRF